MENTQNNKSIELTTARLVLRRMTMNDAEEMFTNWAFDPIVTEYLSWDYHKDIWETEKHLRDVMERYDSDPLYLEWGIVIKETGELIGNISAKCDAEGRMVLGWVLGHRWWGHGYMPEAAHRVLEYLFTELGIREAKSCHIIENLKSGRVMQKIGMHFVEDCMDTYNGRTVFKRWYSVTKEEFLNRADNFNFQ